MSSSNRGPLLRSEDGFVLAVAVVFAVVLTIVGFLVAAMTRADIQVVTNLRNEKAAFYFAEAGVTEALIRLRQTPTGATTTVDGLTFPFEIDPNEADPNWTARITFDAAPPALSGSEFRTPTLQPAASRLPYSDTLAGAEPKLTIAWARDATGTIRTVAGRQVSRITSTGRSGAARRTVMVDAIRAAGCRGGGLCALDDVCGAVRIQGTPSVSMSGGMTINSSCSTALDLDRNARLVVAGGIDIAGGWNGQGTLLPSPITGAPGVDDPLSALPPPPVDTTCSEHPTGESYTNGTLSPGTYCGGLRFSGSGLVKLRPGIYVIAGGELSITGSPVVQVDPAGGGEGVMFYVTRHPLQPNNWGAVDLGAIGSGAVNLFAPRSGTYQGILLFQDRDNTNTITVDGNLATGLDGTIYAPGAEFFLQDQGGGTKTLRLGLIVGSAYLRSNAVFTDPSTPVALAQTANGFQVIAWRDWADAG
jgi:hypothetical protein